MGFSAQIFKGISELVKEGSDGYLSIDGTELSHLSRSIKNSEKMKLEKNKYIMQKQ